MSYIKFEHRHLGDDRWIGVSPAAFTVHTWALDHCNEQATDGEIPEGRAYRLVCPVPPAELPVAWAELLEAGLWIRNDDAFVCPEFLAHGIAAEEQEATRDKWATDKRRRRLHDVGNHQLCTERSCAAVRSGQVDSGPDVHQWTSGRLDPTRPDQTPKGSGSGGGSDTAGAGAPPADPVERLGRPVHTWTGECCPLPLEHPIHQQPDDRTAA